MVKAVAFDIGQTLVQYNKPLNWSELYRTALEHVAKRCHYLLSEDDYYNGIQILSKYNTRINPREYEVSSKTIFGEILSCWKEKASDLETAKDSFYSFFRNDINLFADVEPVLAEIKKRNLYTATLSDVAYGMDNKYALADISDIINYIDLPLTSNDIGFRKPNTMGLITICEKLHVELDEAIYVGDEEKDIMCANNAGAISVHINRGSHRLEFDQRYTIKSLNELLSILI